MAWFGNFFGDWFGSWFGESFSNVVASVDKGTIVVVGYDATATVEGSITNIVGGGGITFDKLKHNEKAKVETGKLFIFGAGARVKTRASFVVETGRVAVFSGGHVASAGARASVEKTSLSISAMDAEASTVDSELQLVLILVALSEAA
jgi:hypothetical protein